MQKYMKQHPLPLQQRQKKKKSILYIIILIFILLSIFIIILINKNHIFKKHATKLQSVRYITVVATKNDKITEDSTWSGTFQLAWNDLKNEIAKQNIVFDTQPMITKNLNKEDFSKSMMSKDLYLEFYGLKTLDLKSKIENEIKNKFNQTSDILDRFDWSNTNMEERRYFFYSMLQ